MVHLPGVLATKAPVDRGDRGREAAMQAAVWEGDGQDPLEILKAKLELSDLVKQEMKSVIRAQHTKIEEYRKEVLHLKKFMSLKDRAHAHEVMTREQAKPAQAAPEGADEEEAGTYSKVQLHLLEDMRQEVGRSRLERSELEAQVRRLKNVVADLRTRNATLKQASQRHLDMLSQLGALDGQPALFSPLSRTPGALTRSTTACESALVESATEASVEESPTRGAALSKCGTAASLVLGEGLLPEEEAGEEAAPEGEAALAPALGRAGTGALSSPSRGTSRATTKLTPRETPRAARAGQGVGGAVGRRLTQAARHAMSLWHEESPRSLFHQLFHAAAQIVDNSSLALMLFVADPWLRRTMVESSASDGEDRGASCGSQQLLHTTFYLSGKVTVHGYWRGGLRPEPPRFPDLSSLPIQGRGSVLALPVQAGTGRPVLAVVQATGTAAQEPAGDGGAEASTSCNALALSDSQLIALQLLCTTAGGMLDMRRQVESAKAVNTRALGSLDIVAKVHSAASVSEFEQIAKLRMTNFFNVFTARITFYNPASRELLATATRAYRRGDSPKGETNPMPAIGRRNITRISVQDGIVGRCVRKRQIFHLDPVMSSPFVSEAADGVDIDGDKGFVNMLAGPMIADLSDDSSRVVGVLQLIHKRPRREADSLALEQPMAGGGGDAKDKAPRRSGCEAFTQEDQHLFAEMLRVLGMAAYRTMQVQARGDMDEPSGQRLEASIEKLLGIA